MLIEVRPSTAKQVIIITRSWVRAKNTVDRSVVYPHTQRERGICDRGWCPFICMFVYMYVCDPKRI